MLIDILVVAIVVVLVITRFTKFTLPKDPRSKSAMKADLDRLRGRPLVRDDEPTQNPTPIDVTPPKSKTPKLSPRDVQHLPGLEQIKALEPTFNEASFLEGAKSAYQFFLTSWNAKDEAALENLAAPSLTARLVAQLESSSWQPMGPVTLTSATIENARLHGKTAIIEVLFTGEDTGTSKPVRTRWTLARPLNSEDPNWDVQNITDLATH